MRKSEQRKVSRGVDAVSVNRTFRVAEQTMNLIIERKWEITQLRSSESIRETRQIHSQQMTSLYRQENLQYAVRKRQRNEGAEHSHRSPRQEVRQDIQPNFGHRLPAHNNWPDRSRCRLVVNALFFILTGIKVMKFSISKTKLKVFNWILGTDYQPTTINRTDIGVGW